jgi:tetratricopeptide (TPR) repeat protein
MIPVQSFSRLIPLCLSLFILALPANGQKKKKVSAEEMRKMEAHLAKVNAESNFLEGEKYFILEDYTKAFYFFQHVLEQEPDNAPALYKCAEVLSRSNKDEDVRRAAEYIQHALDIDKQNPYYYLLASNIYTGLNDYSKAAGLLETLMKEIPGNERYLFELAAIYQYAKKPEEAIRIYNRAESVYGINETCSQQKQSLYQQMGKVNEALEEARRLVDTFPEEERFVMTYAEALAQNNQVKKATELIEQFVLQHPDAGGSRVLLAGFYRDQGMEDKARTLLREAFVNPTVDVSTKAIVLSTYAEQIAQLRQRNSPNLAVESFGLELAGLLRQSNGQESNVRAVIGDLYVTLDKKAEAEQEYRKAVQLGTARFETWQNLFSLLSDNRQFDSLIYYTEQGMEYFPNQALLYYFNGYGHLRKKHYRESVTGLEQARRLASKEVVLLTEINVLLGDAYNGTKDFVKSDRAFDEALSFNPNNDYVLNNYSYYLATRKEHLDKANQMAALAVKNNPDNSSYLDTYAWVLFMEGKYKEARKIMERAIAQPDITAAHWEHYGDILFQLGEVDEAVKQWEKARNMTSQHDLLDKKIANRRLY